jgi:hypothetical protein
MEILLSKIIKEINKKSIFFTSKFVFSPVERSAYCCCQVVDVNVFCEVLRVLQQL